MVTSSRQSQFAEPELAPRDIAQRRLSADSTAIACWPWTCVNFEALEFGKRCAALRPVARQAARVGCTSAECRFFLEAYPKTDKW